MINKRLAASILIGVIGFLAVLGAAGSMGIVWDEAIYIRSARRYVSWLATLRADPATALSRASITENWGAAAAGPEAAGALGDLHPPLVKVAAGLSWRIFRGSLGDLLSFRLAPALIFGLLLGTLFLWVSETAGMVAGAAAVLCLSFMPRFFAFANVVALDMPLATVSLLAAYVYWKTIERPGLRWALPFGIMWGLALGVKNGGVLLPLGLGMWMLVYHRTWRNMLRLALSGVVALIVFVGSWPWLYYDTLGRLKIYVKFFFLTHDDLLVMQSYYLGQSYAKTPWHYPLVMTSVVVPLTILLIIVVGLLAVARDGRKARTGWLFVLGALGPMLPFLTGLAAAYDGERLFLPAFPFLAALGGLGFVRLRDAVWQLLWRRMPRLVARRDSRAVAFLVTALLLFGLCALPARAIMRLHPHQLAYYSELVGGIPGAAQLGLETTFWADSYGAILDDLNQRVAAHEAVWADAYSVLKVYQEFGMLRADIVIRGSNVSEPSAAQFAVVQARQSRYFPVVLRLMASAAPQTIVRVDGVPLVMVFRVQ